MYLLGIVGTKIMDLKKARGRQIALLGGITKKGSVWLVRSQTRPGVKYKVTIKDKVKSCCCPDFLTNGKNCKHIHAVIHRVEYPKPDLVDPPTKPIESQRKTYPQDWRNYNRAQRQEKSLFMRLLKGLTETIEDERAHGPGRPRIPLNDTVFATIYKTYSRMPARRFEDDLKAAHHAGFISRIPHFNSILNTLSDPRMTQVLLDFIDITSAPLSGFEQVFAADSSGFTSSKYDRWIDVKTAALREEHTWTKVHLMCGTVTHIVTAAVIKEQDASDTKQLPELLDKTAKNFKMQEVYADKAYGSIKNYNKCAEHGAVPYILFKSNHTGSGKGTSGKDAETEGGKLWKKMFHAFQYHREDFLRHYHQRSNVETVFSMIKAKFGGNVRSRTETAALNEVLCKIVCHNICVLIKAMFELGLNLDGLLAPRLKPNFQVINGGLSESPDR